MSLFDAEKFRDAVISARKKWWVKIVLLPIIAFAPSLPLGLSKYFIVLDALFRDYPLLPAGLLAWPLCVSIVIGLVDHWATKSSPLDAEDFAQLLAALDHVVGKKLHRFREAEGEFCCKERRNLNGKTVFKKITQPQIQIEEIVAGVYLYFRGVSDLRGLDTGRNRIKVALAEMGKEHITKFNCYFPKDGGGPQSKIENLRKHTSGFSSAKRAGKLIIVDDIASEEQRPDTERHFETTHQSRSGAEGSMICYPIKRSDDDIPYVLSVVATKRGFFIEKGREKYELVMRAFAQRIVMEHCLLTLKSKAQ